MTYSWKLRWNLFLRNLGWQRRGYWLSLDQGRIPRPYWRYVNHLSYADMPQPVVPASSEVPQ